MNDERRFRGSVAAKLVCVGLLPLVVAALSALAAAVTETLIRGGVDVAPFVGIGAFAAVALRLVLAGVLRDGDEIVVRNALRTYRVTASAFRCQRRPGRWTANGYPVLHMRVGDRWIPVHAFSTITDRSEEAVRAFRSSGLRVARGGQG